MSTVTLESVILQGGRSEFGEVFVWVGIPRYNRLIAA
jgi:hypothetical protein